MLDKNDLKQIGDLMDRQSKTLTDLMDAKFDKFALIVKEGFDGVDKRFEQVDKRFEQVDKRFEQVNERFEEINQTLVEIRGDIFGIKDRLDKIEDRLSTLEEKIDNMERLIERNSGDAKAALGDIENIKKTLKKHNIIVPKLVVE